MAVKTASSALPLDFFTPHPRRPKGKERAAPERNFPDVTASAPPSCTGIKRSSSIRGGVSRLRARRLSTRKTMHAPTREPLPSVEPFTRPVDMAQRRHASSLPEPLGASGSSAPAWQQRRWHQSIQDYSSGRTSDLEEAWHAFEDLCRSDGGCSLEVHDMYDFASRIVAAAADHHIDRVFPDKLRRHGTMVLDVMQRLSARLTEDSPILDKLRRDCLLISAAAMEDRFDVANEGLRKLLDAPVGDDHRHQYVAQMLIVYATALYVHHSALSVVDALLQYWSEFRPYLTRLNNMRFPHHIWVQVCTLRERFTDIITRVEQPALIMADLPQDMVTLQRQRFGEYLIETFCRRDTVLVALDILEAIKKAKQVVRLDVQLGVVKALVQAGAFQQANDLFTALAEYMSVDKWFDTYQEAGLYVFARQGDIKRSQEYYGRLAQRKRVNTTHKALMLHAHAVKGDTRRATELFYHFFPPVNSSPQVEPPNIYHYTAVILAYSKKGDLMGLNTWLASMGKAGIAPDAHVYNIILKSFAQRGDVDYVAELLDKMRASGIRPSRHEYTTVLAVFAERRDVRAAEELYQRAMKEGIIPDRMMISALMDVYVEAGEWQGVVRTFDYLKTSSRRGIRMTIEVYNTLLKAYVLIGAPFRVVANLFQRIEEIGLRPDARTFALLIQSACDSGLIWIAKDLLLEMTRLSKNPDSRIRLNVYVLTIMIAGWLRVGERERARRLYDNMRNHGIQPSATTYAAIVKEYATDKTNAGLQIAQEFIRNLVTADSEKKQRWMETSPSRRDALDTLFAPLLAAYARRQRPEVVEGLITQIEEAGGTQTLGTLTHLLDVHRRRGNGEAVRELWPRIYELAKKHAQLNTLLMDDDGESQASLRGLGFALCIPLSIYVDAMSSAGFHDEVARTWAQLQKDKLAFDSHNWNHLVVALIRAGEAERAFQVIEKVIIPARRRLIGLVIQDRDQNPASPIRDPPVGKASEADEEQFIDDMIAEDELPDGATLDMDSNRPPNRDRRAQLSKTNTRKGADELEPRSADFARSLHILHQVSPMWNDWRPHTVVLVMLNHALQQLSRGRPLRPLRPANAGPEPFPTMQELRDGRARAAEILRNIRKTCPVTVRVVEKSASQRWSPKMRRIQNRLLRDKAMI